MKVSAKLKDQARRHEQREEWDAAIEVYLRVLRDSDERDVADLPLYNRVGDLYLRMGRGDDAVRYYAQAATQYAEAGLYNNAIALCNKALRYAPTRLDLLRQLGIYSASQGFLTDARYWFLEFAERAFRRGELDDAFGALDELARISDDAETRELFARRLHVHGRSERARAEFRRALRMRVRSGENEAADKLRDEILRLYPDEDLDSAELDRDGDRDANGRSQDGVAPGLPTLSDEGDEVPSAPGLPAVDSPHAVDTPPGHLEGFERTSLAEGGGAAGAVATPDTAWAVGPAAPGTDPGWSEAEHTGDNGARDLSAREAGTRTSGQPATAPTGDGYVDLAALLGFNESESEQTRFFVQETDPTGDEDRDFAELLTQFKEQLAEHIAHDDGSSHYDLGLAFKDMGLIDEAIAQFQNALRAGSTERLKIYEELGQCFLFKQQYKIAIKVLSRAMEFERGDELELIGVYYLLGCAHEELGQRAEAIDAYERVVGLDINFRDVAQRMARL